MQILKHTDFTNPIQLRELLLQCKMQMEQAVIDSGNAIAMKRVMAGVSAEGVAMEYTSGFSYLQAVRAMESRDDLGEALKQLCQRIVDVGRLTVGITGSRNPDAEEALLEGLPNTGMRAPVCCLKPWGIRREGIIIPADISFAVCGGRCPYTGTMQVAAQVLSLAYLWNAIRVQGGAYGAGMGLAERGCSVFYSYRDPNAAGSLNCYTQSAQFLREFAGACDDIAGFIIGTISSTEPVLLPGRQGKTADGWYFKGQSYECRCAMRKGILETTASDLIAAAEAIDSMLTDSSICVVGEKSQIEQCHMDTVFVL